MKPQEALIIYRGLCKLVEENHRLSETAAGICADVFEIAEGRADAEDVIVTEQERMAALLAVSRFRLIHNLPRDVADDIADAVPTPAEDTVHSYGPNWSSIRNEALTRDLARCQRCGMADDTHRARYGHGLHIHHKIPFRQFDSRGRANKLSNLKTLCARCHRIVESA